MNIKSLNHRYMYKHKADVYREKIVVLEDLSKKTMLEKVAKNIPCRLSIMSIDRPEHGDISVAKEAFKLFTSIDADIKRGDVVKVGEARYTAGEAIFYEHHKEIVLLRVEI